MATPSSTNDLNIVEGYKRAKAICSKYPISPASLWRKVKAGTFPRPIKLSTGITAWRNIDLLEWEKDPLNYKAKP
ncbi:AlpA family phage regulatory protein [Polynucleobacter sp.]|uniref:helix-turn-helix transcriptional regulator n=1 Tax=Polynucleobacter sp. TaxID=2029855 RepID=UPI00261AB4B3|nr:AlpA family phage regulatory protein [Polynucleobacter sp.]MCW1966412.1 AlpA family phage regulatory protein [Polynucleobacter sp.]